MLRCDFNASTCRSNCPSRYWACISVTSQSSVVSGSTNTVSARGTHSTTDTRTNVFNPLCRCQDQGYVITKAAHVRTVRLRTNPSDWPRAFGNSSAFLHKVTINNKIDQKAMTATTFVIEMFKLAAACNACTYG